jgi:hypothetical protein
MFFPTSAADRTVAALVFVRVLVEMRHFRRRPSARDHVDQLLADERGLAQIGSLSWGAWIATSVPIRTGGRIGSLPCPDRYVGRTMGFARR